jgi:hypothetical protein
MPEIHVNVGGTVKKAEEVHVNDNGTVKEVLEAYVNEGGTVKLVFQKFTGPTVPTEPLNLRVTTFDTVSITMAWDLPASDGGSPITGYEVWRATDGVNFTRRAQPTGLTYNDIGLTGATTYWYYILAKNAIGLSPASNTVIQQTDTAAAPGTPGMTVVNTADDTITVNIFAPGSGGTPDLYRVRYRRAGSADAFVEVTYPTPGTKTITGVNSAYAYELSCRAENALGNSAYSATRYCLTTGGTSRIVTGAPNEQDVGAYKDWGWGKSTITGGPVFGSISSTSIGPYIFEQVAQAGATAMSVVLEGTSRPASFFRWITFRLGSESNTDCPSARTFLQWELTLNPDWNGIGSLYQINRTCMPNTSPTGTVYVWIFSTTA